MLTLYNRITEQFSLSNMLTPMFDNGRDGDCYEGSIERFISMKMQGKSLFTGMTVAMAVLLVIGTLTLFLHFTTASKAQTQAHSLIPGQTRHFTLYVRSNWMKMADGQKVFVFGYTDNPNGHAQVPGPTLIVNQGDNVYVTIINDKDPTKTTYNPTGDGHTIHLHGLDLPSIMDGDPMTAPGGHPVMQGQQYTYHFIAQYSGTYYYHCHQSAAEHIQMGMYGALIIRPNGEPNNAYADTPMFDKEYTFVLSEMDSVSHTVDYGNLYQGGKDVNWTNYHADYFLMNGKSWPDTLNDPNDNITATVGQTVLVRLINTGYQVHSMHSHGFHFLVVGTDGRKLASPYYKDTIDVSPGERYDIIFVFNQAGRYMFHDHIEQNMTNNGAYPGGMATMISVNNRDGSNPVPMQQIMSSMHS